MLLLSYYLDRVFLYCLIALVFKKLVGITYWYVPLFMIPIVFWDMFDDYKLGKSIKNAKSKTKR